MDTALLRFTSFYLNVGLTHSFAPDDPTWQEFLAGYRDAAEPVAWVHSFYLAHARTPGESPYGCFSYAYEPDTRSIRFHFADRDTSGYGPLSGERLQARRRDLTAMFADIKREIPIRGRGARALVDVQPRRLSTPVSPGVCGRRRSSRARLPIHVPVGPIPRPSRGGAARSDRQFPRAYNGRDNRRRARV